jgi:malonyl-CoA decarboxylase
MVSMSRLSTLSITTSTARSRRRSCSIWVSTTQTTATRSVKCNVRRIVPASSYRFTRVLFRDYHEDRTERILQGGGGDSKNNAVETFRRIVDLVRQKQTSAVHTRRARSLVVIDRDLAQAFSKQYSELPFILSKTDCQRALLLETLAQECSITESTVASAVANYTRVSSFNDPDVRLSQVRDRLRQASTPLYEDIFNCLLESSTSHSVRFLVSCRADVKRYRDWLQQQQHHHPSPRHNNNTSDTLQNLKPLEEHLRQLLATWFSPSVLEVERITYDTTPTAVIERMVRREAVHPVQSLADLRSRLGPTRRVFQLLHPYLLPNTPLVVVHVSLQTGIPSTMAQVLQDEPAVPTQTTVPTVAAFYSISNTEPGLAGMGLGEFHLKQAKARVQTEFPSIQTFVTLSPLPGFSKWLEQQRYEQQGKFADSSISTWVADRFHCDPAQALPKLFLQLADRDTNCILDNDDDSIVLKDCLLHLAAHYLVEEKHRGKPLDPVARFHVGNGAAIHTIHWNANPSRKGWKSSFGLMVTYHYDDNDCDNDGEEACHYETTAGGVRVHENVMALLREE